MSSSSLSQVYQQIEVNSCNNLKLVVMLYDGAIRFLTEARAAMVNKDFRTKAIALDRALAIIGELQATLRLDEGGDIAASLNDLYLYMNEVLLQASARMDYTLVDQVIKLLRTINAGWTEIARKADQPSNEVLQVDATLLNEVPRLSGEQRFLELVG
jgi:flagellar protein FliS